MVERGLDIIHAVLVRRWVGTADGCVEGGKCIKSIIYIPQAVMAWLNELVTAQRIEVHEKTTEHTIGASTVGVTEALQGTRQVGRARLIARGERLCGG